MGAVLARHGCEAMLRATYVDGTDSYVITVGVAAMPGSAQVNAAKRELAGVVGGSNGAGVRTVPVAGSPAALFTDSRRQLSGSVSAGPYLVFYAIGYTDGRPSEPVSADSYADAEMTCAGAGVAQAVASEVGKSVPPPTLPRDAGMLSPARFPAGARLVRGGRGGRAAAARGAGRVARPRPTRSGTASSGCSTCLNVPAAWMNAEGAGVTVAVIDSGVNPDVSPTSTGSVITGPDLTGLSTPSQQPALGRARHLDGVDHRGHGHDGGGSGIEGVAPEAKILSIRVIPDKDDPGYRLQYEPEQTIQDELADGIMTAVKDDAQVISMSIGYSAPSGAVRAAISTPTTTAWCSSLRRATRALTTRTARAAPACAPVSFPAEYPGVLGVGALYRNGTAANFSSDNLSVKVAAPGQAVPAQGRTACTRPSTAPARRARWWRASPR